MTNIPLGLLAGGAALIGGGSLQAQLGNPNNRRTVAEKRSFEMRHPLVHWFAEHNRPIVRGFYAFGLAMILAGLVAWLVTR